MEKFTDILKERFGENEPILVEEILDEFSDISRQAVYKKIDAAMEEGLLARYDRGVYYLPTETRFGASRPSGRQSTWQTRRASQPRCPILWKSQRTRRVRARAKSSLSAAGSASHSKDRVVPLTPAMLMPSGFSILSRPKMFHCSNITR